MGNNMRIIKLGTKNDTYTYAIRDDFDRYIKMSDEDARCAQPDAKIYFDSGVYPSITDVDQHMCDEASNL